MNETLNSIPLESLRRGDRETFARFVEASSPQIYRMLVRMMGDEQDAEDVLQETYIKAFQALSSFEGRSSLSTWLYRIAVNEALMSIRKHKNNAVSLDDDYSNNLETEDREMEIVDFCCLPEGELLSNESRRFLDQAVQQLPETLRMVFIMRDLEGLSIQDAAEALGISENNVKIRLLRARMKLREDLSVYFSGKVREETR